MDKCLKCSLFGFCDKKLKEICRREQVLNELRKGVKVVFEVAPEVVKGD